MDPISHKSRYNRDSPSEKEGYDIAQICLNGHCINEAITAAPQLNEDFCHRCGQPTIMQCNNCNAPIKGHLQGSYFTTYHPPAFCYKCGTAFPWTQTRIETAIQLANELENLDANDKNLIASTITDIVHDGPKTTEAATRFKKIMIKAGSGAAESMKKLIIEIVSETAKKVIWPNG